MRFFINQKNKYLHMKITRDTWTVKLRFYEPFWRKSHLTNKWNFLIDWYIIHFFCPSFCSYRYGKCDFLTASQDRRISFVCEDLKFLIGLHWVIYLVRRLSVMEQILNITTTKNYLLKPSLFLLLWYILDLNICSLNHLVWILHIHDFMCFATYGCYHPCLFLNIWKYFTSL